MRNAQNLWIAAALLANASIAIPVEAQPLDKVRFGTNWVAEAEHGGFYQAVADGTYAKYGLEVTIVPGGPNANSRILLPVGKLDFYMSANTLQSFDAVANNIPTVTVAASFQKDPQVLIARRAVAQKLEATEDRKIEPNDVVLVPLTDLPLTDLGKKAAQESAGSTCSEALGGVREAQRKVAQEIPALIADVKGGRYVDAAARGSRFLASGALTEPEQALVHRQLLEAYVALEATGLATQSCTEWRRRDKAAVLDPVELSPKILAACARGGM